MDDVHLAVCLSLLIRYWQEECCNSAMHLRLLSSHWLKNKYVHFFFHTEPWCVRNHMLSVALMFKDHQHENWLSHMFEWIARRSAFVEQRNRCIGLAATTRAFKAFSKLLSLLFNVLTTCHVPGLPGQCEHSAIIYWIYPLTQHSIDYARVCACVCENVRRL